MAKGSIHTVYKDDGWVNEFELGAELGMPHRKKEDAVAAGRERAQADRAEHVIHNKDGTVGERNTYGDTSAARTG